MKRAIIICSGGLDSVTAAYYAKKTLEFKKISILFFDYGQRNLRNELISSKKCALDLKAEFEMIKINLKGKSSSILLSSKSKVNKISKESLKNTHKEGKKWYVPGRNLVFISYAISYAESLFLRDNVKSTVFLGFKSEGVENYPDTSLAFLNLANKISFLSTESKPQIKAPFIKKDKEEIISMAYELKVPLEYTFSCYNNLSKHCGYCLACMLRKQGFYWANIKDPTLYLN